MQPVVPPKTRIKTKMVNIFFWHLYIILHRITKSNSSENPRGFNIKFKIKIMKKQIENFIVKCVCKGIEMYVSQHRFGFNGMLEMLPLTNEDFKKHLSKQLTEEAAKSYLETVPTIHPQDVQ